MKSKDSKCRYLIIDAKSVVNYPLDVINGSFNAYNRCDQPFIDLNEIFEEYDIPQKYRYLIIRVNNLFSKNDCQEYLEETPFGYVVCKQDDGSKVIRGRTVAKYTKSIIEFETPMNFLSYDSAMRMLVNITNDGLFDKYKAALSKMLNLELTSEKINQIAKSRKRIKATN